VEQQTERIKIYVVIFEGTPRIKVQKMYLKQRVGVYQTKHLGKTYICKYMIETPTIVRKLSRTS
jgi:hypothetical protein